MAKQGQRYDEKTQTGWKFENGRSNYYVKGKKLSTKQVISRGLKPAADFAKNVASSVFAPITDGAKNIAQGNVTFLRHPKSTTGESRQQYNTRIAKEQLAIQKKLDENPEVLKNEAAKKNMSSDEFFGVGNYGDETVANANVRKFDNKAISAQHRLRISKLDPWSVAGLEAKFGDGSKFSMSNLKEVQENPGKGTTATGDNITDNTLLYKTTQEKTGEQKPFINQVSSDVKPNRAGLKSDIFTLDADGKALGVMTRGQRRLWEAANQDLLAKNKLKIGDRTYANRVGSG